MDFNTVSKVWCNLNADSDIFIFSDSERLPIAEEIRKDNLDYVSDIKIYTPANDNYMTIFKALRPNDLLLVILSIKSFIDDGYRDIFPSFSKPKGIKSKYAFIRLDIPKGELLRGINTDIDEVEAIISSLKTIDKNTSVKVTSPAGTDITTKVKNKWTLPFKTINDGENAFLPPPEVEFELCVRATNGTIAVDVTVGELRINGVQVDELGIVDSTVFIEVKDGAVTNICGGKIADRLSKGISSLKKEDLSVVELGVGLSAIEATGIIGVDESMSGTCHFGIGNGVPLHLDVVIRSPIIEIIDSSN